MPSLLIKPPSSNPYTKLENLPYDDISSSYVLDLWAPNNKGSDGKPWPYCPLIIYVHGGGFISGTEETGVWPVDRGFPGLGFAIASIRYPLADEAPWPQPLLAIKSAIRYLVAHSAAFRLYSGKRGILGDSAGGTLALLCGMTNGIARFDVGNYLHSSSNVTVVMDDFGITDFGALVQAKPELAAPDSYVSRFLGAPALTVPDRMGDASPITYVSPASAPTAILHGDADTTVPPAQSDAMYRKLLAAGVDTAFTLEPGKGHGWSFSSQWVAAVAGMFDGYLRP